MKEYHSIPRINWGSFRGRREDKWGPLRGRFGDHFRVGDNFGVGIISGAVQAPSFNNINWIGFYHLIKQRFWMGQNAGYFNKANQRYSFISSGVCQFWKKRKQWSTSPTITWSPWRWSFSKHTKWRTRERKEYWQKFSFILVSSSLLFVFSLLWIGKYLEDKE